ncbi:hypothetical protein [Streptantibioticus ferralitis]|uniref:Lipoprotein n=1 Tax=Streptantibioticus ferralitis TaxID=236510 RepID=A0ABT5YVA9_9ACTN|nr:hypothetical protein [Streptantibioticus ferralitis]MDF2255547.1 hypothetical protein [Streptantibioticus ferralitis]
MVTERRQRGWLRIPCVLGGLAALTASVSGCGHQAVAQSPAPCSTLPPAQLPHSAGTLTQADSGTYCLPVGGQLDVFLTAKSAQMSARWSPVASSAPQLLAPTNGGALTPPVGVTPAVFVGTAPGTVRLSSRTADGRHWQATVRIK